MLTTLKLQTALRSFTSSSITLGSSHPRTTNVKSRLFPCREPRSFAEWEADIIDCARKFDMEGIEMRSMMLEGHIREVAVYERKKKTKDAGEEEYVLVEVVNARGAHICLLKFEREGLEVQIQKTMGWDANSAAAVAGSSHSDQVFKNRRRLSASALEPRRSSAKALDVAQRKRTRSNGARLVPTKRPAHVPVPTFKQIIIRRDTVFSTSVRRSDTVHKIVRFGKKGPPMLHLFIALSTINKCEQTTIGHGKRWFVAAFVGILQGTYEEQRVWINKDKVASRDEQNKQEITVSEDELLVFLEDFIARKARSMINLQTWDDATESEARTRRLVCARKKYIARQDVRLVREVENARNAEAEAWRKTYRSLEALEEARVKLRLAEEDRVVAEEERKKAEECRSKVEARFAKVEAAERGLALS